MIIKSFHISAFIVFDKLCDFLNLASQKKRSLEKFTCVEKILFIQTHSTIKLDEFARC